MSDMNNCLCLCNHYRTRHHRGTSSCNVPTCSCEAFVLKSKRYTISKGHRVGIKGKVYSLSQLNKGGRIPPYAEEIL
jgi:hypothetical protein